MNEEKLYDLIGRATAAGFNASAAGLWAEAAKLAETLEKHEEHVFCLLELVTAYHSQSKVPHMLAPFVKARELYREHPEAFHDINMHVFAWAYRHVLGAMASIPEVPVATLEELLGDAHEFYKTIGDSRRALFQRDYDFAKLIGDQEAAEVAHANWQNAEITELSNCPACDPEVEVLYLIDKEEYARAIAHGEDAIARGEMTCASQPYSMLTTLMGAYYKEDQLQKAWDTHQRVYRYIKTTPNMAWMLPPHLRLLARLGARGQEACIERGLELFVRHLPWWLESEDPGFLVAISRACAMVCEVADPEKILPITLPGGQLPWQPDNSIENPTVAHAFQWCYEVAHNLCARYDARPGLENGHAVADFAEELEELRNSTDIAGELADINFVTDITGLSASNVEDIINNAEDQDTESGTPAASSGTSASGADLPTLDEPSHDLLSKVESIDFAIKEFNPDAPLEELLRLHHQTSQQWSSYLLRAIETGIDEFQLDHATKAGKRRAQSSTGEGRILLDAESCMEDNNPGQAKELYTQLLLEDPHRHTDPLGTRIQALQGLGEAHALNKQPAEAIRYLRAAMNLCAAASITGPQIDQAATIVAALATLDRKEEACIVAETALTKAESIQVAPGWQLPTMAVRQSYYELLRDTDDNRNAAVQALALADFCADLVPPMRWMWLDNAAFHYYLEHEFERVHELMGMLIDELERESNVEVLLGANAEHHYTSYAFLIARQPWETTAKERAKIVELFDAAEALLAKGGDDTHERMEQLHGHRAQAMGIAGDVEEAQAYFDEYCRVLAERGDDAGLLNALMDNATMYLSFLPAHSEIVETIVDKAEALLKKMRAHGTVLPASEMQETAMTLMMLRQALTQQNM